MKKIIQKHNDCIGCGLCAAICSDFWEISDDNKAKPKSGILNQSSGDYEFEVEDEKIGCNKDAADSCPVKVIKIV